MIKNWQEQELQKLPSSDGFRLRGENMNRLEVFSDAAFAFAVTTLVVTSGEIPGDYEELLEAFKKVPSFALCFAQMAVFWMTHRSWSRRYGLEDIWATFYTMLMVFTILVYVIPLRLFFSMFMAWIVTPGVLPAEFEATSEQDVIGLFIMYGVGFGVLSFSLMMLFMHSLARKMQLGLNKFEIISTKLGIAIWLIQTVVGFLTALIAWVTPTIVAINSPFLFLILPVGIPLCVRYYARQARELKLTEA